MNPTVPLAIETERKTVAQILRDLPPAQRESAIRSATNEIIALLDGVFASVGFPKEDGRWSPVLAHDLEAVRQQILNPRRLRPEFEAGPHDLGAEAFRGMQGWAG